MLLQTRGSSHSPRCRIFFGPLPVVWHQAHMSRRKKPGKIIIRGTLLIKWTQNATEHVRLFGGGLEFDPLRSCCSRSLALFHPARAQGGKKKERVPSLSPLWLNPLCRVPPCVRLLFVRSLNPDLSGHHLHKQTGVKQLREAADKTVSRRGGGCSAVF